MIDKQEPEGMKKTSIRVEDLSGGSLTYALGLAQSKSGKTIMEFADGLAVSGDSGEAFRAVIKEYVGATVDVPDFLIDTQA